MAISALFLWLLSAGAAVAPVPQAAPSRPVAEVVDGPGQWKLVRQADPIRGGDAVALVLESANRHGFAPPYQGGSALRLWLAGNAAGGAGAMIELTRGQLLCPVAASCTALVRFDDRPARRIALERMEDGAGGRLRVVDGESFAHDLIRARRLAIEVVVYREGAPRYDFDVTGLAGLLAGQMP